MKKNLLNALLAFCVVLLTMPASAQAPGSFNYQGVARNASGTPLASKTIAIQISILQDAANGTAVYTETHSLTTTALGYFTLQVGTGTVTYGTFAAVNWGNGHTKWLEVSIDQAGGSSYVLMGSSQLVSVPYALYAAKAGSTNLTGQAPLNVTNNVVKINAGTTTGDLLSWDGNNWVARQPEAPTSYDTTINNMQPYLPLNYCIALEGVFPSRNGFEPFLGEIELFGFNFAPKGWATCSGQLLSIAQNQALFSLLGTYYGGDGRTTFALPDLRGRTPINVGQGQGLQNYDIGVPGGTETNKLNIHR